MERFRDRTEAGRLLGQALRERTDLADRPDVLVLGLPRGGVVVAAEVARALHAPLDAFVVRKIGVPGHEELAMGAIASGGIRVVNEDVRASLLIPPEVFELAAAREEQELARREAAYRGERPPVDMRGRCVILVDDGLATGASMRAAVRAVKQREPARVVVAVPVAPPDTCRQIERMGVEVLCLSMPEDFGGVGRFYDDFAQTTDEEVRELLHVSTPH
ncbi:hypothetical protein TH66_07760 [Carbonactinospora thermoautotrophica]|uniref:Phosphoribosyltransferase domain-containing protein n=1 Tax=Carbonactinospora thermoautotrophica TaxID=1469144 RepID=A0A132NEB7_9ACTN|nr:phosphoribosyltransferase family protein [Carbonactinospora thermoautotrophica]KWX04460.1 hypothetical protein TH66_07760 [Carbonactinospora thermoautotrophica]KWX08336.1 hypothetical protein TR74_15460 [Carbonactinospora thermoautotrophica]